MKQDQLRRPIRFPHLLEDFAPDVLGVAEDARGEIALLIGRRRARDLRRRQRGLRLVRQGRAPACKQQAGRHKDGDCAFPQVSRSVKSTAATFFVHSIRSAISRRRLCVARGNSATLPNVA